MRDRILVVALVVAAAAGMAWGMGGAWKDGGGVPPRLDSTDFDERKAAAETLVAEANRARDKVVAQFVAVIEAEPQDMDRTLYAPRALALDALGQLHADAQLPLIIGQIEYDAAELITEDVPWAGMPAVRALMGIGLPSVKYILGPEVLSGASPKALRRFAIVVRYVFPDAKTARAFLDAYDPGYDAAARAKHAELVKLVAKHP